MIYFSLDGHTKMVAELVTQELKADLIELKTAKEYPKKGFKKYLLCGKAALFREKPILKTKIPNLEIYDLIFIGTPIWAGNCAPAINTLLSNYSFAGKKVGLIITNSGGSISRCVKQISKALNESVLLTPIHLVNPKQEEKEKISQVIRERLREMGCL